MLREKLVDLRISSAAATHSGMIEPATARSIYEQAEDEIREMLKDANAE